MCGRYARFAAVEMICRHFGVEIPPAAPPDNLLPSWNVAPQTMQPVIRLDRDTGRREIVLMLWGLVPSFAKSPVFNFSTVNAKAETLLTKPTFREPFRKRRCLVPVDNYFEWQVTGPRKKTKQTWAVGLKTEKPFALGGIWDRWVSPDQRTVLESYSIVTTETNELLAPLHDRMPLIIAKRDEQRWLERGDPQRPPIDLLRPFDSEWMKCWRVKPDVGNVRNNRPDLIDPYEPPPDPEEPRLF
jgi:putative SOS response-associated peptidase YedK